MGNIFVQRHEKQVSHNLFLNHSGVSRKLTILVGKELLHYVNVFQLSSPGQVAMTEICTFYRFMEECLEIYKNCIAVYHSLYKKLSPLGVTNSFKNNHFTNLV